ncbi:MAG TPA: TonB-dependent receptor [Segetibacter sp.]
MRITILLKSLFFFLTFSIFSLNTTQAQSTGKISGIVKNVTTGEAISGASIKVAGTSIGALTNADGAFTLNTIKAGTYNIEASFISFGTKVIPKVVVVAGQTTTISINMTTSSSALDEVVVKGRRRTSGTEVAVLSELRRTNGVASGVSSQTIQRTGDLDAAQVVKRIPGITIVDNRFINIRGLAERYNSIQLNNVVAPSLETDIRSFSFDLIPSSQIDRVMVYKSPSSDLPGDFAGGAVKVFVKSIPDENSLVVDYSLGYRENATFKPFSRPNSGEYYFTGFNHGDNDLPVNFPKNLRTVSSGFRNAAGHSLTNSWQPVTNTAAPDQRMSIYGSRRFNINNKLLTNITAISYSNTKPASDVDRSDFNTYNQGSSAIYHYNDRQFNYNVRLGIIHNWAFKLDDRNTFEFKNLFNQLSTAQVTNRTGRNFEAAYSPDSYSFNNLYRGVYSGQLTGTHTLANNNTKADWVIGYGKSYRDQPDYKRYRSDVQDNGTKVLFVPTGAAAAEFLGRFYSKMNEDIKTAGFNIEHKLNPEGKTFTPSIKVGGYFEDKDRNFTSRNIGYVRASSASFNNDLLLQPIDVLFNWENINTNTGIRIDEQSNPNDNYTAANRLYAGYANFILPYKNKLTFVAGARVENNVQSLNSADDQGPVNVKNDITRLLPSANLTYNFTPKALIRLAYGKTLNRPEFRELAPFSFYDFDLNFTNRGNPLLKTASIDNYDLKYEYYPSPSEIISLSVFHKRFVNPIETVFVPGAGSGGAKTFTYGNAQSAQNSGVELELRKSLNGVTKSAFLDNITLLLNASYINSEITLGSIAAGQSDKRPLQGQSPYLINTAIFYNNAKSGWQVNLLYNVIGKRIAYIGYSGYPDIYDMPKNLIDINISKAISKKVTIKGYFNDLLNQENLLLQDGNEDGKFDRKNDQVISKYKTGRMVRLSIAYKIF